MENIESKNKKNLFSKINWKKVFEYSAPAIVTILICLVSLIINKCFPFGENDVGYIDYEEGLIPAYTGLWNFLHGKANFFIDWNLGAGGNTLASWMLNSFLSPISWLIAFFPKEGIVHGIAFLVIIRLALMATTAFICFKKLFPNVNNIILYLFVFSFTFSGWTLVHFTNVGWLDLMILLPLLLLEAKKLVEENKSLWFIVILSYLLMLSYYITYMILVGVVGIATIYICVLAKDKKKVAAKLFYAIIISILISAFAFFPSCLASLQGHRFSGQAAVDKSILVENFWSKLVTLTISFFPIPFFMRLLFNYKKDKKNILFFLLSFIFLVIGLFIEPINLMWHTGSYYCFPYRYSFIIILFMTIGALYYIDKHLTDTVKEKDSKKLFDINQILTLVSTVITAVLLLINFLLGADAHPYKDFGFKLAWPSVLLFIFGYLFIESWLRNPNKKFKIGKMNSAIIIFVLCITQSTVLMSRFIADDEVLSYRTTNCFEIETDNLDRNYKLKDADTLYNSNMAYLTSFPTMQTWIHISSEEQWQAHTKLGFNYQSTMLYSSGGTPLSDLIVGNKYFLTQKSMDETHFKLIDEFEYTDKYEIGNEKPIESMYLYESKLTTQPILTTDVDLTTLIKDFSYEEAYKIQNTLYKALFNKTEDIMGEIEFTLTQQDNKCILSAIIPENKTIYLQNNNSALLAHFNDEEIYFYSGLTALQTTGTTLQMELPNELNNLVNKSFEKIKEEVSLTYFDTSLFYQTYSNYVNQNQTSLEINSGEISVNINNVENRKYALIPYSNLKNIVATNNGKECTVLSGLEGFIMVELNEGQNNIKFTFKPNLFTPCLLITLVAIVLLIIFTLLNRKFKIDSKKVVIWPGFIGAIVILVAVGFLVYLKPFFNFFTILFS